MEEWRAVVGYEDYYISSTGQVQGPRKLLKQSLGGKYYQVQLGHRGPQPLVHRLVAEAFVPNPENKPQVNHIDGNKLNNNVSNLEWVTASENSLHSCHVLGKKGKPPHYNGSKNPASKLTEQQVAEIREKLKQGAVGKQLAKEYSVSTTVISCIKNNKTYRLP